MRFYLGFSDDGGDVALFIDAKCGAVGPVVFASHEFLEPPDPIFNQIDLVLSPTDQEIV